MKKIYQKAKIIAKFWNEKQQEFKRMDISRGVQPKEHPVKVHYIGNVFEFTPECELDERVARILAQKRWYIELVGEPYEKIDLKTDPTDAAEEDIHKFGEVYLCQYCGWPYPKKASRNIHERRWCKRKGD